MDPFQYLSEDTFANSPQTCISVHNSMVMESWEHPMYSCSYPPLSPTSHSPVELAPIYHAGYFPYTTSQYNIQPQGHPSYVPQYHPQLMQVPSQPIHAPVPISAGPTLLHSFSSTPERRVDWQSPTCAESVGHSSPSLDSNAEVGAEDHCGFKGLQDPLEHYANSPQVIIPTPCELLTDLASRKQTPDIVLSLPCTPIAHPIARLSPAPVRDSKSLSPPGTNNTKAEERESARSVDDYPSESEGATALRPENQRKAHFRSIAEFVGFKPTDPDTITSHDKKRCYLECVEQYILWLHDQLHRLGQEPVKIERVTEYRGISTRSIRTMLVHSQLSVREQYQKLLSEEHRHLELQSKTLTRGAAMRYSPYSMPNTASRRPS